METTTGLLALITFAALGIVGTLGILRRQRLGTHPGTTESPFAISTEGMIRCPHCAMGNMVGDVTCAGCRRDLPH